MIKDSKLIGTKITAPFGWKKFKVGELFDFKSSMSLNKSDLKFVSKQDLFAIPYITRTVVNNGINGYVDSRLVGDEYINDGGEFAFGLLGLVTFYQCNRYCTGQFVKRFVPKFELNELLAMFFKTLLDKQIELFKTVSISSYNKLINDVLEIELPVTSSNQPDFEWMSAYIKAVKADYLDQKELSNQREIKDYLIAGKVDSMDVTDADRQFLRDFEKLPRRKFKVGELFVPTNPKRYDLKISDIIDNNGNTTVISSTTVNQGIKGYSLLNPLVKANKIVYSDAVGPSMMFYQERDFIADAHVKYLEPRFTDEINRNLAMYLIACIQKSTFGVYSYGNKYNNDAVNNTIIELPVIGSSQVDVQSIEKYMRIQSKPLINKVAETLAPVGEADN